jgi:restriction system protein
MGRMIFEIGVLADSLSETVGFKAGLALSLEELCDHLDGTEYPDTIRASEQHAVHLRAEEYEVLFYKLLHRVGYTTEVYDGDITGIKYFHKYRHQGSAEWAGVTELFIEMWPKLMAATHASGSKSIDPRPFIKAAFDRFGKTGLDMAMERLDAIDKGLKLSPHSIMRYTEWNSAIALAALFKGSKDAPEFGRFIDQRYIDYLSKNDAQIGSIHWRKFEELTAEFFHREGYIVQLGPGSNDDGVDVRVWHPGQNPADNPHCLIQCKRQQHKVERVVIKGLLADVLFEEAQLGLVVTSSELSPGARATISARGYPVQEINRSGLIEWLQKLRTPGTGIVRV